METEKALATSATQCKALGKIMKKFAEMQEELISDIVNMKSYDNHALAKSLLKDKEGYYDTIKEIEKMSSSLPTLLKASLFNAFEEIEEYARED